MPDSALTCPSSGIASRNEGANAGRKKSPADGVWSAGRDRKRTLTPAWYAWPRIRQRTLHIRETPGNGVSRYSQGEKHAPCATLCTSSSSSRSARSAANLPPPPPTLSVPNHPPPRRGASAGLLLSSFGPTSNPRCSSCRRRDAAYTTAHTKNRTARNSTSRSGHQLKVGIRFPSDRTPGVGRGVTRPALASGGWPPRPPRRCRTRCSRPPPPPRAAAT